MILVLATRWFIVAFYDSVIIDVTRIFSYEWFVLLNGE